MVGKPRQEDFFIGDLLQELLSPLFPLVMPGVEDLWSYGETGYHSLAAAVVSERYKREAMASAFRILGEGQLSLTKFLLVTDRPVDLSDFRATLEHVLERTDPRPICSSLEPVDGHPRLHRAEVNEGSKGVWLGWASRCASCRASSRRASCRRGHRRRASSAAAAWSSAALGGRGARGAARLAAHPAFADWPLVVLTDEPRARRREPDELPLDHLHPLRAGGRHPSPRQRGGTQPPRLRAADLIDARLKPGFPDELFCDEDDRAGDAPLARVLPDGVEMGDSGLGHLNGTNPDRQSD